jgi:hypothetical protein
VNASGDGALAYLDSSELVKLIALEPETAALRAEFARWPQRVSSLLEDLHNHLPSVVIERRVRHER